MSVPAEIRRKLGLGPGSVLEWDDEHGQVVLRRVGRFTSEEIHHALFGPSGPKRRSVAELKAGIRRHVKTRHAGR